jgi:DNA-binding transcriptional MerR regulator
LNSSSHDAAGSRVIGAAKKGKLSGAPMGKPSGKPADGELTISQTRLRYNVTLRTLRFYEDQGLISPRRDGGGRFYGDEARKCLEMVLVGRILGFSVSEIKTILDSNVSNSATFEQLLPNQKILEQVEHLEERREEIGIAIARLRGQLRQRVEGDEF